MSQTRRKWDKPFPQLVRPTLGFYPVRTRSSTLSKNTLRKKGAGCRQRIQTATKTAGFRKTKLHVFCAGMLFHSCHFTIRTSSPSLLGLAILIGGHATVLIHSNRAQSRRWNLCHGSHSPGHPQKHLKSSKIKVSLCKFREYVDALKTWTFIV